MEGDINWTLVFGVLAIAGHIVAAVFLFLWLTTRSRRVSATDELDIVQKVAEATDKRLFETLNAIPVALVETDRQGKFVFANKAAYQLLGRRDSELIGLRFHSATWGITFPDGRPIPPDLLPSARALRGQTVKGFQHVLANPASRRKMMVSVTAMPIEDETGAVTGSTAAIVEIEGLAAAQPQLIETAPAPVDDLSRRVFDAARSALVVVAPTGVVLSANAAALTRLGRSEDVLGVDFADQFLPEALRVEGRQWIRTALHAPAGEVQPLAAPAIDGVGLINWRIAPLADADGSAGALLLAGDPVAAPQADPRDDEIDRLRAERDAARAETDRLRLRQDDEAMPAAALPDFKALLGVMTTALDMMLKQADDPSRVRRLGQAALEAGRRGQAMADRLAAISPPAAQTAVLDAAVLLRAMEPGLRNLAGPAVDLLVEAPPAPARVSVDPVGFEGAVKALVANAVQAASGAAASVAIRLETRDDAVRVSIRDSGAGMDADLVRRAMEAFVTGRDGPGLGMTQARAFAQAAGGDLIVESRPGEPAEIVLALPHAA